MLEGMEPTEIREFSEQMQEAGEASMTHVSLAISVLAVLVAMVTVLGHRQHTEAVLMQSRATDQWNQYQAHKIRAQQVGVAGDLLALSPGSGSAAVQAKMSEYRAHLKKWTEELKTDQEKALELEAEVAVAERKAGRFDLGEALLQIAVVLASITLLTRHWRYVVVALVLGSAGLLVAASALVVH